MIPFIKEFDAAYGQAVRVSPLIRRVVAKNAGRFTGPGTGTFLVGRGSVAIIDPGPDDSGYLAAIEKALGGETISHVFVTHQHMDHSPLGRRLADRYGAILCGGRGVCTDEHGGGVRGEAADDGVFVPDLELEDGWTAAGPDWTLRAVHTPGHTPRHFCFALEEENSLFCGDHIMAWSTSIVSPPDGRMSDYLKSLERVRDMSFSRLLPTHGAHIEHPRKFIDAYIGHRLAREKAIFDLVQNGVGLAREIVSILYADVDRALHAAAMHSVWAHLLHLVEQGRLSASPAPSIDAHYTAQTGDISACSKDARAEAA